MQGNFPFLACLDEVQEELLYYPWRRRWRWRWQNVKVFYVKVFLCDGQGAARQAISVHVTGLVIFFYAPVTIVRGH